MSVIERWTIYVCTGCGLATGRHKDCDAMREAVEVVPLVEYNAQAEQHRGAVDLLRRAQVAIDGDLTGKPAEPTRDVLDAITAYLAGGQ